MQHYTYIKKGLFVVKPFKKKAKFKIKFISAAKYGMLVDKKEYGENTVYFIDNSLDDIIQEVIMKTVFFRNKRLVKR